MIILAPLRGVTTAVFNRCYFRHFSGAVDFAIAPFITSAKEAAAADFSSIPQILPKNAAEARTILEALRSKGHTRVDINGGCPWPQIIKKGRGAGLLRNKENLAEILECACEIFPGGVSFKTRLGVTATDEVRGIIENVLNNFSLVFLTIHARTAAQRYEGAADFSAFARAADFSKNLVVYNGDVSAANPAPWKDVMIGRGAIAAISAEREKMRAFLRDFHEEVFPSRNPLGTLKELWKYLDVPEVLPSILHAETLDAYRAAAADFF